MKKVAIEEHFTTEEHLDYLRTIIDKSYPDTKVLEEEEYLEMEIRWIPSSRSSSSLSGGNTVLTSLLEVGNGRLRAMDEAGIDIQVLSLVSPGVQVLDTSTAVAAMKRYNDRLSEIIREHPDRFAGLASLAPQNPGEAADELERAVSELGLKGASINSHVKGEYLDDKKYWPIFERAAKLGAPIYVHPRIPSPDMIKPYLAYPSLPLAMWGFGAEVGLHAVRLICSGVFDSYPELKIILGHLGEGLPFWLWRIENRWLLDPLSKERLKKPGEYIRDNFVFSTSGMFWHKVLSYCCDVLGSDRILFAADYPFESGKAAVEFIDTAPLNETDREKICHSNAEDLLKL
jgi:5-carboxyvanillate decarboxylase